MNNIGPYTVLYNCNPARYIIPYIVRASEYIKHIKFIRIIRINMRAYVCVCVSIYVFASCLVLRIGAVARKRIVRIEISWGNHDLEHDPKGTGIQTDRTRAFVSRNVPWIFVNWIFSDSHALCSARTRADPNRDGMVGPRVEKRRNSPRGYRTRWHRFCRRHL